MDDEYEQVLLVKPDVFIYRIPPIAPGRAYRASDWKLDTPDWTGRLRLVVKGEKCSLNIEDKQTGKLFAKCFIDEYPGNTIESVADSSRYFVIKIKNEVDGRLASIGMGFTDRGDSFDLNVALQDHFKRIEKQEEIEKEFNKQDADNPKMDLSLKEGQTIKVNLNIGKKSTSANRPRPKAAGGVGLSGGILPPPPTGIKIAPPPSFQTFSGLSSTTATANPSFNSSVSQAKPEVNFFGEDIWGSSESSTSASKTAAPSKPSAQNLLVEFDDLAIKPKSPNEEEKWGDFASHGKTESSSWENF